MSGDAPTQPNFPDVTVLLGDPRIADGSKREGAFHEEDFATRDAMKAAFATLDGYTFRYLDDHTTILEELRREPPQFVINFCDTGFRNDPTRELNLPAYLEMLGVPYSGAPPAAMVLAWDKSVVRAMALACGIDVPDEVYVAPDDDVEACMPARYPAFIKPSCADGSVGITVDAIVQDRAAAIKRVRAVQAELPGRAILVQEFLSGTEYGVGVIGNPDRGFTALPPLEVDYASLDPALPRLLGFESKAMPDSPYWSDIHFREAQLSRQERTAIEAAATTMFERLSLRDYGRFDFRADADGRIKFMECNPNPAWSNDGKLAYMAGFAGMEYRDMLRLILETAQARAAAEMGLV
ncbi:MAG TPA: D-alanine--D-alanine ligase [Alphaproteobacteria bacterium]|nr:D-alanine--D-alanine ligase [Alphaproteobacteria bacterium]